MRPLLLSCLLLISLPSYAEEAVTPSAQSKTVSPIISPAAAATLLEQKQVILLDVRDTDEWQKQRIPGALHIPLAQLKDRLSELAPYAQTPIVTQCHSGGRSAKAAKLLTAAGFSNATSLDGGIEAWKKAGLKTE